jgi:hypothetical protein
LVVLIPSYHGATEAEIEGEVSVIIYFYYVISVKKKVNEDRPSPHDCLF